MTKKIEGLLAVLDMPEVEQVQFLVDYLESSIDQSYLPNQLADLAFRLRDEVGSNTLFLNSLQKVAWYVKAKAPPALWGVSYAQPIHWIISSLIAKELSNENRS